MTSRSLTLRLMVPAACGALLFAAVCGLAVSYALSQRQGDEQRDNLWRAAALIRDWSGNNYAAADSAFAAHTAELHSAAAALGGRLILTDASKHILFDSDATDAGIPGSTPANLTAAAYEPLAPGRPDSPLLYLVDRRAGWAGPVAVISILAGVPAALIFAAIFWWLIRQNWMLPSRKLLRNAEQLASGNWQTRVHPQGADELQMLGSRINSLAAEAQKELADLDGRRAGLQALVDALPDPIILTDAARRIALINAPAARLLAIAPAKAIGKKLVSVVTDEAIVDLVEPIGDRAVGLVRDQPGSDTPDNHRTDRNGSANGESDAPQPVEIRLNRNGQRLTYLALATRTRVGGTLIVLRDVSRLASAAQMKSDFVANASHELRTPVAAIQLSFETLREVYAEDPQQMLKCVGIIEANLLRLGEILGDLLDLSRVESTDLMPSNDTIVFDDLFALLETTIGPVAKQRGVTLVCAPDCPEILWGDRRLLDLILKNLVDNAIKFTSAGGSVTVGLQELPADDLGRHPLRPGVVLTVADTGIGIPSEHLERVFERFYQVNQARAGVPRRGTGLGLAIVKHAVHAMGGRIRLDSVVGKGTTVICEFPQPDARQADVNGGAGRLTANILESLSESRQQSRS
jgi:two-component system, OmpR family, phosphate regulon sensor histidine kinase PhoR